MDACDGDGVDAQAVDDADGAAWVDRLRTGSRLRGGGDGADDDHRERVNDSAGRALTEHAEVLKRLKDADTGNDADDATTE